MCQERRLKEEEEGGDISQAAPPQVRQEPVQVDDAGDDFEEEFDSDDEQGGGSAPPADTYVDAPPPPRFGAMAGDSIGRHGVAKAEEKEMGVLERYHAAMEANDDEQEAPAERVQVVVPQPPSLKVPNFINVPSLSYTNLAFSSQLRFVFPGGGREHR